MSKIKRNDPCLCGSGKKYKKCCGAFTSGTVNLNTINSQLDHLQQRFISFVSHHYQQDIEDKITQYESSTLEQHENVYRIGITFWLLLHVPFIKGETIFHIFLKSYQTQLDQLTKKLVENWLNQAPAAYEVIDIHKRTRRLKIQDLLTQKIYEVPYNEQEDFIKGSIIIGILVPYAALHNFFYGIVHLKYYDKEQITKLLQLYNERNELIQNYPTLLRDILLLNVTLHDEVAQLFAKHLRDKGIDEKIIVRGMTLWNNYCMESHPSYQKIEPYAAALEYLVQKLYIPDSTVTQAQIAKEYDISPGTVSTNFRKLVSTLKEHHHEIARL